MLKWTRQRKTKFKKVRNPSTYSNAVNIKSIMHIGTKDSQPAEELLPEDQLYAQVDKTKKAKKDETAVDQLYAQVDNKKQKSKEKEVCPAGAVYSVVNKPSPPQIPTKSQQLLEELHIM